MRLSLRHRASLALLPFAIIVSGCDKQVTPRTALPPAADLTVEAKPPPTVDILTDAAADARYNNAVEAWGERGWTAVARLCRWARANGAAVDCPEPRRFP